MNHKTQPFPDYADRASVLNAQRNLKMARSPHAYVRGNTLKFYEWLNTRTDKLPHGPAVWICGDCHIGNLGPLANSEGSVEIQMRDFDQTVIGNPTHDLIRLGLSLATAARGSALPGVTTAKMLEEMVHGYEEVFSEDIETLDGKGSKPASIQFVLDRSLQRSWKQLARERIVDTKPTIPLGKRFWPISRRETLEIKDLFGQDEVRRIVTSLRDRDDNAEVQVLDAAYWMKGCSSLGRLRFAVLVEVRSKSAQTRELCLMDVKEAIRAAAPSYPEARLPRNHAQRVVSGARQLAPFLGERMLAARLLGRAVFIRGLLPQDLKLEIDTLPREEAMKAARFLATVVAKGHARQLDADLRKKWRAELRRNRTKKLDAPTWLWTSVVELLVSHEGGYLEHCRKYALQ